MLLVVMWSQLVNWSGPTAWRSAEREEKSSQTDWLLQGWMGVKLLQFI